MDLDGARNFNQSAYEAARQRMTTAPLTLTADDFAVLAVVSHSLVREAQEAQRQARAAQQAAVPVITKGAETSPVSETVDQFLVRLGIAAVETAGVSYNSQAYQTAVHRYWSAPATLTVADIQQLGLVDARLGQQARAKQLGYVKPAASEDATLAQMHVTGKFLMHWITNYFHPLLASCRYKSREAHARIDALELQIVELQARLAAKELV